MAGLAGATVEYMQASLTLAHHSVEVRAVGGGLGRAVDLDRRSVAALVVVGDLGGLERERGVVQDGDEAVQLGVAGVLGLRGDRLLGDGRVVERQRGIERLDLVGRRHDGAGGRGSLDEVGVDVAQAAGHPGVGLNRHREAARLRWRQVRTPSVGISPWVYSTVHP